jgi:hypothetical protein
MPQCVLGGAAPGADPTSASSLVRNPPLSPNAKAMLWELEKIRNYIEENPVRAGLVREASEHW